MSTRPKPPWRTPTERGRSRTPWWPRVLPPGEHLLDSGYVDAELVLTSQSRQGIEVVGPMRPDSSWQARSPDRYDLSRFTIDWAARTVTCPEGRTNTSWTPHLDA